MTVRLLREVLDEMNVKYSKNLKKADLVKKVREARKERLSDNAGDSASRSSKSSGVGSAHPKDRSCKNGKNIGRPVLVLYYNWTLPISVNISIFIHCTKHNLYGYKYVRDYLCSSSFDPSDSTVIGECSVR